MNIPLATMNITYKNDLVDLSHKNLKSEEQRAIVDI